MIKKLFLLTLIILVLSVFVGAQLNLQFDDEEIIPESIVPVQVNTETTVDESGQQVVAIKYETCSDGIQNQGEEDVDCGGPCSPCHSDLSAYSKYIMVIVSIIIVFLIIFLIFKHKNPETEQQQNKGAAK